MAAGDAEGAAKLLKREGFADVIIHPGIEAGIAIAA